jgi:hypothetical protein
VASAAQGYSLKAVLRRWEASKAVNDLSCQRWRWSFTRTFCYAQCVEIPPKPKCFSLLQEAYRALVGRSFWP